MAIGHVECGRTCACLLDATCTADRVAEFRALGDGITLVNDEGATTADGNSTTRVDRAAGPAGSQLESAIRTGNVDRVCVVVDVQGVAVEICILQAELIDRAATEAGGPIDPHGEREFVPDQVWQGLPATIGIVITGLESRG